MLMMDSRAHGKCEGQSLPIGGGARCHQCNFGRAGVHRGPRETPGGYFRSRRIHSAGIALQSAGSDSHIETVVTEAPFAGLREATHDYAALHKYSWLGKTLFVPGAMLYRGQALAGFPASGVSPKDAVALRALPVMLICDTADTTLACRGAERIYAAAKGPKSLWTVPGLITLALFFLADPTSDPAITHSS